MLQPKTRVATLLITGTLSVIILTSVLFCIPQIFTLALATSQKETVVPAAPSNEFPVTVDPFNKLIVENPQVNAFLDSPSSPLQAAVANTSTTLWDIFSWLAAAIADMPWYQSLAAADGRVVTIAPGMRKEQVASIFAKALGWNAKQQQAFLTPAASSTLPLVEGSFSPGTYLVESGATPQEAQALVNDRFMQDVLSHYGTTTENIVPLKDALIIASIIQRETIGTSDMRMVSGVIWNRLFADMNLQIDSTVQYAKANSKAIQSWWPKVFPGDISRKSPYNTYLNNGLPPTPIASPSVAAILAALNPIKTSCLYYFNDRAGNIHCTDSYAAHVALLKKYYGRGK